MLQLLKRTAMASPGDRAPAWLRWLPVLVLLGLLPAHLLTPDNVRLSFLIVAMPPLAALVNGPLFTSLLSLVAITEFVLFYLLADTPDGWHDTATDGLSTMFGIVVMSILMAWVRDRYNNRLVRVSTVARSAQLALLPHIPDAVGALRCAAWYRPAEQDTMVGGDMFDVQDTSYGVRVMVADVKGHGLGVVATVAALLGSFREGALDDSTLDGIGGRLERRMAWDNAGRDEWRTSFATSLLMEFPPGNREVRLTSFGHPTPLLLRRGRVRELVAPPGPPLGLAGQLRGGVTTVSARLQTDDVLLAYTDGVTEARDRQGTFYPLVERVTRRLADEPHVTAAQLVEFIDVDLDDFGARRRDDMAVLAIRVSP
ncbi:stage II sporulation protein E [Stackebrandtia albiflava]|uniref:Stage II sporulation protein E n=1 Tax=Stackebrandtia albiflava TaxID=406432 RepID=A0A562UQQ7_9ACTN|nr:PP2C family protein-serine/threonine phosphatase [Stackebrandtia albiflava]TWJ07949.1 stage II sporulation protein E [Stackebrandtia albiflava]